MFASFLGRLFHSAENRRGPQLPTHVRRLDRSNDPLSGELTRIERLSDGDCILCVAGEILPCDGTVVEGTAMVSTPSSERSAQVHVRAGIGSRVVAGMILFSQYVIVRVGDSESPRSA